MKLLMHTRYGRDGASSRMRSYQYVPWLESAGIHVTVSSLLSDTYVAGLQQGRKSISEAARAYLRRVQQLIDSRSYDLIWIEKEAFPWLPTWVEKVFQPGHIPYVLDYDDAVFHCYDQHRNPVVRAALAGKHPALIRDAAMVVAGNEYLAEYSQRAGAKRVALVPTVVDLQRYPKPAVCTRVGVGPPCIGWIGQRATAGFLSPYASLFTRLSTLGLARFAAIGIDATTLGLPMDSIAWTEATEVEAIRGFDIGIMPLEDAPFERGKCGYKLIQYMACGLPVVASPVGVNRQIVEHGVNGFLAETLEEWEQYLGTLLNDQGLRQRMGQAGRLKVEQQYCIQATGPVLARLLKQAAGR